MLSWLAGLMIRRGVRRLNTGDIAPMLSSYAGNATSVFPGEHSWGGVYEGKQSIEAFLNRCVGAGIQFDITDVIVSGWPWAATLCLRLTNNVTSPEGVVVYSNRAFIFARTSWGKIKFQETYEDTQRIAALDEYLASRGSIAA